MEDIKEINEQVLKESSETFQRLESMRSSILELFIDEQRQVQ